MTQLCSSAIWCLTSSLFLVPLYRFSKSTTVLVISYASSSRLKSWNQDESRTFVPFVEQIMHMMDLKPLVPKFWKYLIRAVPSAPQIPRAIPDQPLG